ncbi:MAG: SDR family oxidoreductase [Anaerolineaceae bacterium]|nr:SDR family oxidoreductase [Anaerolineaceae bacterium]
MTEKVAIVTGGTSGIGLCTAAALANKGCKVYTFSRRESNDSRFTHIRVDVTDPDAAEAAVRRVKETEGHLDIVINCAGYGISGAIEFTPLEDAKRQMDVNFFGMVNVNKPALTIMREQGHGRIVNTSSMAAVFAIPFQAYYSASKAAINSYTCALLNEVKPYGISVCAILPGDIKTDFTAARKKIETGNQEYGGRIERSVAKMEKDEQSGLDPKIAGNFIAKIALKNKVKPLYSIDLISGAECVLDRILPKSLAYKIVGSMYDGK